MRNAFLLAGVIALLQAKSWAHHDHSESVSAAANTVVSQTGPTSVTTGGYVSMVNGDSVYVADAMLRWRMADFSLAGYLPLQISDNSMIPQAGLFLAWQPRLSARWSLSFGGSWWLPIDDGDAGHRGGPTFGLFHSIGSLRAFVEGQYLFGERRPDSQLVTHDADGISYTPGIVVSLGEHLLGARVTHNVSADLVTMGAFTEHPMVRGRDLSIRVRVHYSRTVGDCDGCWQTGASLIFQLNQSKENNENSSLYTVTSRRRLR